MSPFLLAALALAPQDPLPLRAGTPFSGELHVLDHTSQQFEVEVPADCVFLKLRVVAHGVDVDLYGGPNFEPEDLEQATLSSSGDTGVEVLVADRLSDPPVSGGAWWFTLAAAKVEPPSTGDPPRSRVPYTLELVLLRPRTDAVLVPGAARTFLLEPASGSFRTFRIDVPEGARALRVDLHGAPANLELFARRGSPMISVADAHARCQHPWGAETLLLTGGSRPSVQPGAWYVDVLDATLADASTSFEVRVALDEAAPPEWSAPPRLAPREPPKPLSRALCAVIEVFSGEGGGSATLITADGLALTTAHVVDRGDGAPLDEVALAVNLDSRRPPEEAFRGKVVRFDADLDLALIQLDRGFYGAALPADYRFPTVELAPEGELDIGDTLWIVGFPSLGGTGSRVPIHCARGVASGFDPQRFGLFLKTDAAVFPGNSGGAALDERGRLVGVPAASVSDESGTVGLVAPLALLPAEWRELIAARAKR